MIGVVAYKTTPRDGPNMERSEFVDRLNERLDHDAYAAVDASPNGLQVGSEEDGGSIDRAAFAVDGVEATVREAAAVDADVLVVHHGFIWGDIDRVTGLEYDRIAACIENDLSLYVSHLPLDGHETLGNAAGLAAFLDAERRGPFGDHGGVTIGQRARFPAPVRPRRSRRASRNWTPAVGPSERSISVRTRSKRSQSSPVPERIGFARPPRPASTRS